jgi:hypothetical protein
MPLLFDHFEICEVQSLRRLPAVKLDPNTFGAHLPAAKTDNGAIRRPGPGSGLAKLAEANSIADLKRFRLHQPAL